MYAFPKSARLLRKGQFANVFDLGQKSVCRELVMIATSKRQDNEGTTRIVGPRLGIIVTKKVGNAVVRNRIKRSIRSAFRHLRRDLLSIPSVKEHDLIIIARHTARDASIEEIQSALLKCAHRLEQNANKRVALDQ